jgi:hypothetical protein
MAYRVGMPSVILGLALLALWLYCLFDVITTPDQVVRNLPKVLWIFVVVLLAALGGLFWLLLGRPRATVIAYGPASDIRRWPPHSGAPVGPDDDPEFLRQLDRRLRDED